MGASVLHPLGPANTPADLGTLLTVPYPRSPSPGYLLPPPLPAHGYLHGSVTFLKTQYIGRLRAQRGHRLGYEAASRWREHGQDNYHGHDANFTWWMGVVVGYNTGREIKTAW